MNVEQRADQYEAIRVLRYEIGSIYEFGTDSTDVAVKQALDSLLTLIEEVINEQASKQSTE